MIYCKYCDTNKNNDEFPLAGVIKGKVYKRKKCNTCYSAMKRDRKRSLAKWLLEYKKDLSCSRCGMKDFRCIHFHHKNDDKEFAVAEGARRGFSIEKIKEEINKCEPLCANCYEIEHYEEKRVLD